MSEAFSNVAMTYLLSLPLAAAAIGWVAATATARIRTVNLAQLNPDPMSTTKATGPVPDAPESRTTGRTLRRVVTVVAVVMTITLLFLAR